MPNTIESESISSVCTTAEELIKSKDFLKWIKIILEKVKYFDEDYKKYIYKLFTKLQNSEDLEKVEKEDLKKFMLDPTVSELWQELLSKLKNVSVEVKANNSKELSSFSKLLEEIFSEDWVKKVQSYVWEVANTTELTLNKYDWMKKVSIKIDWKTKILYMDKLNLKVDSSQWEKIEIDLGSEKINPERDITEFLEWNLIWEQLFNLEAAKRELEKQWKRLPDNKELQAIIYEIWVKEIKKLFLGYHEDSIFYNYKYGGLNFWTATNSGSTYNSISLFEGCTDFKVQTAQKLSMFSVCCIKD